MKPQLLEKYKEILEKRCSRLPLLHLREDSIRYDFFSALTEIEKIDPWKIDLEVALDHRAYILRENTNSKRKEQRLIDLVIQEPPHYSCFEFGLFRQNSNDDGTINKTNRMVKLLNDILRLGLEHHFTNKASYFVAVADDKMLGHQLRSKILGKFPSDYLVVKDTIKKQLESKTSDFDMGICERFFELDLTIEASLIFNEKLNAEKINREARVVVWKIKSLLPK